MIAHSARRFSECARVCVLSHKYVRHETEVVEAERKTKSTEEVCVDVKCVWQVCVASVCGHVISSVG